MRKIYNAATSLNKKLALVVVLGIVFLCSLSAEVHGQNQNFAMTQMRYNEKDNNNYIDVQTSLHNSISHPDYGKEVLKDSSSNDLKNLLN